MMREIITAFNKEYLSERRCWEDKISLFHLVYGDHFLPTDPADFSACFGKSIATEPQKLRKIQCLSVSVASIPVVKL